MATRERSRQLFARACELFPGGVNSPVRAFLAVGGTPVFLAKGAGASVWDADGNRYTDFLGSWGPRIPGHAHPAVVAAVAEAAQQGTSFGASTEREVLLGEAVRAAFPAMEKMRLVSSGTEATMSALRVARGFTGAEQADQVSEGGYHGHADMLLASAGSGVATLGIPGSAGVTAAAVADTWWSPSTTRRRWWTALAANPGQVAALIVEPIPANMGVLLPQPGDPEALRAMCDRAGALLIFDEVIPAFWVGQGRPGQVRLGDGFRSHRAVHGRGQADGAGHSERPGSRRAPGIRFPDGAATDRRREDILDRQSATAASRGGDRRRADRDRYGDGKSRLLRPPGGEIRRAPCCFGRRRAWNDEEREIADEFLTTPPRSARNARPPPPRIARRDWPRC